MRASEMICILQLCRKQVIWSWGHTVQAFDGTICEASNHQKEEKGH